MSWVPFITSTERRMGGGRREGEREGGREEGRKEEEEEEEQVYALLRVEE